MVTKSISITQGDINWTWYFNDSFGNTNQTTTWGVSVDRRDLDEDGELDVNDQLLYDESFVTTSGVTNLNITIAGNSTNGTYAGLLELRFYDDNTLLINFTHNFTQNRFDLSQVTLTLDSNSLIVNLSQQLQINKSLYVTDRSFSSLCVKDAEITTIAEISANCNGANETDFTTCISNNTGVTLNGITCVDQGSVIELRNLTHSAVKGTQSTTSTITQHSGNNVHWCTSNSNCLSGQQCINNQCVQNTPIETIAKPTCQGDNCNTPQIVATNACTDNFQCKTNEGEKCLNKKCVKLFDILILDFNSTTKPGEFLGFTYDVKGMAEINDDVTVKFWIEKNANVITTGQDVIYLANYQEKNKTAKLLIPTTIQPGVYTFYVQVKYNEYAATSFRTIEIQLDEKTGELKISEVKPTANYELPIVILVTIIIVAWFLKRKVKPSNFNLLNRQKTKH